MKRFEASSTIAQSRKKALFFFLGSSMILFSTLVFFPYLFHGQVVYGAYLRRHRKSQRIIINYYLILFAQVKSIPNHRKLSAKKSKINCGLSLRN